MEEAAYNDLIESLPDNERAMLVETKRLGKATATVLRPVTKSPTTGEPLAYGLTRELSRLQELGLVRRVARTKVRTYEVVPRSAVEEESEKYKLRGKKAKPRKRSQRSAKARRAQMRGAIEQGDYTEFYRVHLRVTELAEYVSRQITRMALWEAAPKDDLAQVVEE